MALTAAYKNNTIRIDASLIGSYLSEDKISALKTDIDNATEAVRNKTGKGAEFLGWLEPSKIITKAEHKKIKETAARLRDKTDVMAVVGIGGSYLGTRACYEALRTPGSSYVLKYAGTNISSNYHADLVASLEGARFGINVISKSGTTTEPAIAFRILRGILEKAAGKKDMGALIVATTDAKKGALRQLADKSGWTSFIVPDDVGGRYSVLTPVGLFPLAYAGVDTDALLNGAVDCAGLCSEKDIARNPARLYASVRHLLYRNGIPIELLAAFEPRLGQLVEWWKQLAGESEGKGGSGLFPAGVIFTRDLHSLGQWIQEGPRILFETFLTVEGGEPSLTVPDIDTGDADDGLSYLVGRELSNINKIAQDATMLAHAEGGCPNLSIILPKMDAYHLGVLIYFFEYAVAITGYMAKINPFDQPGVEVYKKKMFELLGKPGV